MTVGFEGMLRSRPVVALAPPPSLWESPAPGSFRGAVFGAIAAGSPRATDFAIGARIALGCGARAACAFMDTLSAPRHAERRRPSCRDQAVGWAGRRSSGGNGSSKSLASSRCETPRRLASMSASGEPTTQPQSSAAEAMRAVWRQQRPKSLAAPPTRSPMSLAASSCREHAIPSRADLKRAEGRNENLLANAAAAGGDGSRACTRSCWPSSLQPTGSLQPQGSLDSMAPPRTMGSPRTP